MPTDNRLPDSPLSLWLAEYGPYAPCPPLAGEVRVDVAVIGGGFLGLATAHRLKHAQPGLAVAVLEHEVVGYGASGRNGSFAMTVVGLGFGTMALIKGKQFVRDAHHYMERAVDGLEALIRDNGLDCDYTRPGFLRMATTPGYVRRIQHDIELVHALGIDGIEWLDRDAARARVNSALYLGAMWEPRLGLMNPAKLVREEKRLALALGAQVYERTPVLEVRRAAPGPGPRFTLTTPAGRVRAEKVVFATNAYSHLFPELWSKQVPAWTYMIATEPLSDRHFAAIGWHARSGVEDARNLIHYYRITPDNRLVMGGGPVGLSYGLNLAQDASEPAWQHLADHMRLLFPALRDVSVTHRWGGPFSVTMDLTPALGYLGDHCAVYSLGCIGHGVSTTHQNALTLVDLLFERQSENTACPFVNRRVIAWPGEPLRSAAARAIRTYLRVEDWWYERGLARPGAPVTQDPATAARPSRQ
jgi:glycine/D-amino acid oxidase-like deaminating enzyme